MLLTRTAPSHRASGTRRPPVRSRLCAAFLVLLIALPFTAPFSTCDLATLLAAPAPPTTEHSLGASTVDTLTNAPVVNMEDDDHVCDLDPPRATAECLTAVVAVAETLPTYVVASTSPLALRL